MKTDSFITAVIGILLFIGLITFAAILGHADALIAELNK